MAEVACACGCGQKIQLDGTGWPFQLSGKETDSKLFFAERSHQRAYEQRNPEAEDSPSTRRLKDSLVD